MNKQEANEKISRLISEAEGLITEAELIADEFELGFDWGLAYGMGGYYTGVPEGADPNKTNSWGEPLYGWQASSQSC